MCVRNVREQGYQKEGAQPLIRCHLSLRRGSHRVAKSPGICHPPSESYSQSQSGEVQVIPITGFYGTV